MLFGNSSSASSRTSLTTDNEEEEEEHEDANGVVGRSSANDVRGAGLGRGSRSQWKPLEVHTVECEVPVSVWPGATAFRPRESVFEC